MAALFFYIFLEIRYKYPRTMAVTKTQRAKPLFELGERLVTIHIYAELEQEALMRALQAHQTGNWGEVTPAQEKANLEALATRKPIVSRYTSGHIRFVIHTNADRTETVVSMTNEYKPNRI